MGGGTILILLLSIVLKLEQNVAQAVNLIFYVPAAITAILIGIKNKNINWRESLIIVIFGIIGSAISASIASKMNVNLLRKLFGAFLLAMGSYEIYSWNKMHIKNKTRHNKNK